MKRLKSFALPLFILLLWAFISQLGLVSTYLVPTPLMVWNAACELYSQGILTEHILTSGQRVLLGFTVTVAAAIPLAVLLFFSKSAEEYLRFVLEFLRNTPPLAMVPLVILWCGIGEASKLAVIILASFFPMFMNALSGLKQVDPRLMEMAGTLDLTGFEKLRFVLFPGALPPIVTGLRLAFGYSWRALIGAELIAASSGLGYMILDAEELARTDIVYVGIIIIGTLGYVFDLLFIKVIRRYFWYAGEGVGA